MKVLLPENTELIGFERELQKTLEQADLAGYALMGFAFREARGRALHEIDALLLIEPCIFVCLEAKSYHGKWTGSQNQKWMSNGNEIKAVGTNPYKQVDKYSFVIEGRLRQQVFNDITFYVNGFIVAPDQAEIAIQDAVVDQFQPGRAVNICHLSKLESVLAGIFTGSKLIDAKTKVREIGLEQIISTLTNISVDQLDQLITTKPSQPRTSSVKPPEEVDEVDQQFASQSTEPAIPEPFAPSTADGINPAPAASTPAEVLSPDADASRPKAGLSSAPSTSTSKPRRSRFKPIAAAAGILLALISTGAAATQFFWNDHACESTETQINDACYKDLARTPLRVGILAPPEQYAKFRTYLKEQLGSRTLDVVIEGSTDMKYTEAQNKIAKREWDVVFALSPMNGMRAKDNGYAWMARMFPDNPPTYQSVLYVKADSSIQSLNDIKTTTKIALGDVSSASSFYMPVYDLFGKSMTVSTGHRSSKIRDLVASGMADIGAGVYSSIKNNPQFRIIHLSREIPGSGVYISPKISAADRDTIQQVMLNAPEDIRKQANYGEGEEPDYEAFRGISLRADEVLSCANFGQQPVQFFCNNQSHSASPQSAEGVVGAVIGFTNQGEGIVSLRFKADSGKVCQISIPLKTMSSIPNGTSPGMINKKRISLIGVNLEDVPGQNCQLMITNPSQIQVL
ncbi:MAG: PhnD/SsuA/transferrin family substrate-binding protein [Elainella sp.]